MVSREHKKAAALHEKLQLLRSITNSHAVNKTSIIIDASKYIADLKQKEVTVKTLEKGFQINVISEKNCPGLLVTVLEAFEELGLNVVEARVSCTGSFHLEAVGENDGENVEAHTVKQAVSQAINNWSESNEQD
ncbi:uncharacterized protein LOC131319049 isoform X2 [Rhododendron vialii]|uniref:uncharacterized protein LOC131319049 isoform X2 n=1 Tax=Rhododendron vialii TaxID=182163 RepID=UPI00265EECBC|nr:uncharacterized protein LOC131319049 isoform X2 [Rhododendron vialii]